MLKIMLIMLKCYKSHQISTSQKQPPSKKKCSGNKQHNYRRTPMLKCDFNKVALQLY